LQNVKISLRRVWQLSHIGIIGAVVSGLVTGAFWSLGPLFAKMQGLETFQLTVFMSATVLGGAVFQLPLGRLSDRMDRRVVVAGAALGGALVSVLMMLLPALFPENGPWLLCVLAFFWGGMVMTQYAICLAHANDAAATEEFVMVGSGMLLTLGFCSAIGAPLASLTMRYLGAPGLFAFTTVCLFVCFVIIMVRRRVHVLPVEEVVEPFRAAADTTTPTVFEMDPRTGEEAINN
jgi:MFS family permease